MSEVWNRTKAGGDNDGVGLVEKIPRDAHTHRHIGNRTAMAHMPDERYRWMQTFEEERQ